MNKQSFRTKTKYLRSLQGILWSKNIKNLDLKRDRVYIVHQFLSYGNLEQIKWLFKAYKPRKIKEIFIKSPKKIYSPAVFYFIKNFILGLKRKKLPEEKYVKNSLRVVK